MADNNRNRDFSHYAGDDNWDKYDDRYGNDRNYGQAQGDYNRVHYTPDNDDNRWEPQGLGNRRRGNEWQGTSGSFNEQRGSGNMNYGGGVQNQYGQGNLGRNYGNEARNRDDWGYAYTNTGFNDEYDRSYYGSHRRHEDDDLNYGRVEHRMRDYDRRGLDNDRREGYRQGDRDLWNRTSHEGSSWGRSDDRQRLEGPYRGKGPKGYTRSVDRIREDVCERLADDDKLDASNIAVRMEGNEVILEGTVETKRDKRRAEDLVDNIPGVTNVQNHLVVGTPTTNAVISAVAERNTDTYANQLDSDRVTDKNRR
jgi:hypothetical protein